ncbi:MAG TPA: carbonic anhydrase [Afifellaceae bacterium]|nr:carbonic anhydrase [Afifellaceae bacterium]
MHDIQELVDGYRRFLAGRYPQEAELYRSLAESGQSPKIMIIACCDSRADPAAIFNAGPGQLFIVRNVANLVPPFEPEGDYHGTSAALEFAVTGLEVETIVVMGHASCGGVEAFLNGIHKQKDQYSFIGGWMSLLETASTEALREAGKGSEENRQRALEHASVRHSIENLKTFPFVKERLDEGRLQLRGAYFGISDGKLLGLDPQSGRFAPVD